jgi:hypothetical protein
MPGKLQATGNVLSARCAGQVEVPETDRGAMPSEVYRGRHGELIQYPETTAWCIYAGRPPEAGTAPIVLGGEGRHLAEM